MVSVNWAHLPLALTELITQWDPVLGAAGGVKQHS